MTAITQEDTSGIEPSDGEDGEFLRLKNMVKAGRSDRSSWITETVRAYNFVANHQWSEADKNMLESQKRPAVSFNRIAPIIKAVCGLEVNNRQDIAYLPREQGDVAVNEAITACAKWVRDENYAADEESKSFRDLAICGEGWTETRMDYDTGTGCPIVEERIYPLEMGTNKGAGRANYMDARLIYRIRDIETEDATALFADKGYLPEAIDARWVGDDVTPADGGQGDKKDYPNETRAGLARSGQRLKKCRVVQVQWWERDHVNIVAQKGVEEIQELSDEEFATFQQRADRVNAAGDPAKAIQFEHARKPQKVYYEAFLGNEGILDKKKISAGMFTFRCMTGERDETKACFYGMLRDMFDPQMWANKWLSQSMNILNSNAKGGLIAEKTAFENQRVAEKDWSDPTKIVFVKDGKLDKVKDRTPPPMPQGLNDLMMFAIGSLRDVSGINLELLGQADREQAASLEQQRRQSAMTILSTLFDSLRRYRLSQGKLILHFIWMLPDGQLVRVMSKGQAKYVPLIKSKDVESYDVIVDEAPHSPNQKQAVWVFITQLLQSGIQLSPPTIVKLLQYSPLPESVVKEIGDSMGVGSDVPPEILKQKLEQAEQALQVLEEKLHEEMDKSKNIENDHSVAMLGVMVNDYKAETERLKAEWDAAKTAQEANADAAATPNPTPQGGGQAGDAGLSAKFDELAGVVKDLVAFIQSGGQPQPAPAGPQPAPAEQMEMSV